MNIVKNINNKRNNYKNSTEYLNALKLEL